MLDAQRLERNRKWLEEERLRLEGELTTIEPALSEGERPGLSTHMADSGTEVFEQAKNLAVGQRLRQTLELVVRALDKMDRGVYGTCEKCGQAIDPARLKALPYAMLCMPCQARAERKTPSR